MISFGRVVSACAGVCVCARLYLVSQRISKVVRSSYMVAHDASQVASFSMPFDRASKQATTTEGDMSGECEACGKGWQKRVI